MNSCNPVLIDVGQRLGPERYYQYFKQFGLLGKTGIDLPGEAGTIMHQPDRTHRWSWRPSLLGSRSNHADPARTTGILPDQRTRITPHIDPCRAGRWSAVHVFTYPKGKRILSTDDVRCVIFLKQVAEEVENAGSRATGSAKDGSLGETSKEPEKYISSFFRVCTGG